MSAGASPWPTEIRVRTAARVLEVDFDNGERIVLPAELLRVESPSAEVKGHGAADRPPPVSGKRDVALVNAEPVGNYAVRLIFSDGHSSGLYPFDLLYRLGRTKDEVWAAYLKRLESFGLRR